MELGERKIPLDTAITMTSVAAIFDLANMLVDLIPFIGWIVGFVIDLVTALAFYIWFNHYEIKLFGSKNWMGTVAALAADAFPLTAFMFPWAIRVGILAFSERKKAERNTDIDTRHMASAWRL